VFVSYEGCVGGTASALGPVNTVDKSGAEAASRRTRVASATATGRRMTQRASLAHPVDSSATVAPRRTASALTRSPSRARSEGTTRTAMSADNSATAAPATAIE
jgi:hypothetical protein